MSNLAKHGPGAELKNVIGTPPASAAGTVVGDAIDVRGFTHLVLEAQAGAATGGPSAQSIAAKVTHSSASGGSYADWQPDGTAASGAIANLTADGTRKRKVVPLTGCDGFVKISKTVTLTGGSSPTWPHGVMVTLCGAHGQQSMPVQLDD